jgi:hypothetical protein
MPGPEAGAVWAERTDTGYRTTFYRYFWTGNEGNRKARAMALGKRLVQGTWYCRWCGDDLYLDKRADTRYCGEGCRKRAARDRRAARYPW